MSTGTRERLTLTEATWYWLLRTGNCPPSVYEQVSPFVHAVSDRLVTITLTEPAARWVRQNITGDSTDADEN